ncbi:MAG: amidohydrolase family protein [Vicinamibacterales bacterium]
MRTSFRCFAAVVAAMTLAIAMPEAQSTPPSKLALVGGKLLTGYETPPIHHAAVLIEGNKIVAIGRAAEMTIPKDATVIDTSGRTMMPGLIDAHAHLMDIGHGNYDRWFPWAEKYGWERIMEVSAKQFLMAGVTSLIDLAGPLKESIAVRDRINRGEIPGPRSHVSGPWVTRSLGRYPPQVPQILVDTPEEASAAVDRLAKAGVDVIKAYNQLRPEHYRAIVQTAHKHRLRVHAHVYSPENVRDALDAGVDVLTHVGSAGTPPYEPDLIKAIVVAGRPVVPTAMHRVWLYPATLDFPERLQDPQLKADFPPDLYKEVMDSFKNWEMLPYFQTTDRQMFFGDASLKQWIDSGAVIGIGTDSGTPMNFNTEGMWREMKVFVDLGMPPLKVISAATRINARLMGMGRELGTIEPGKLADIIVVKGDPIFDLVGSLSNVLVVVKDGKVYKGGPSDTPGRRTTSSGQ